MVELRFEQRRGKWRLAHWLLLSAGIVAYSLSFAERAPTSQHAVQAWVSQAGNVVASLGSNTQSAATQDAEATLQILRARIHELEIENSRLQRAAAVDSTIPARVVRHILRVPYHTMVLDRGSADGVQLGDVVLAERALVGRVEQLTEQSATVLLAIDPNFAIDVRLQQSRTRGVLIGLGQGAELHRAPLLSRLEYLEGESLLAQGEVVVSSGMDGVHPAGIPVGTVQELHYAADGVLRAATVLPFVDWQDVTQVVVLPVP